MSWGFLTNHTHALICIARDPGLRIRDLAERVGITERAAHRIVCDLVEGGYVEKHRLGARNFYEVHPDTPLRREALSDVAIGDILAPILARRTGHDQAA